MERWGLLKKLATAGALLVAFLAGCGGDTANPVGNCFDGTFAADPLHCYVFEQTYANGKLDIEAIYQEGGGLFVYLTQSEPVGQDIYDFMNRKAQEEARRTGEYPCLLEVNGCGNGVLIHLIDIILPPSEVYEGIFLSPGGAEARLSKPGWPAFRKLWPAEEGGATGASGSSGTLDTSEVDTTNFPPLNCKTQAYTTVYSGCLKWADNPGLGIAGFNHAWLDYYQVKVRPGQEEADAEAAKAALHRRYPAYDDDDDRIVVIPVKYDYEELWRWTTLLDRFAYTSSNTLGITAAQMGENWGYAYGGDSVFLVPQNLRLGDFDDKADSRTTIHIWTLELDRTVAALPQLLSQLNIPTEAVGVVSRVDRTPGGRRTTNTANE